MEIKVFPKPGSLWVGPNTRCRLTGRSIYCSACGALAHVGHFAWTDLECLYCGAMVPTHRWRLPPPWTPDAHHSREI